MNIIVHKIAKPIFAPFPRLKQVIYKLYRRIRTIYLSKRYPYGTFLNCNGAYVFCDFSDPNYAWYDGYSAYLEQELNVFTSLFSIKKPHVVLDVGSHWGFYPSFLSKNNHTTSLTKIIAVEPDPHNQAILNKTLSNINNLTILQVNAAISESDGILPLFSSTDSCRHTYPSHESVRDGTVEAISLDSLAARFLQNGEVITHVKVDIDGYEPAFFLGGQNTLQRFKPLVLIEFCAKGLSCSGFNIESYWEMLHSNYFINEMCYPSNILKRLKRNDLPYLVKKTNTGITNLVLIPKDINKVF